MMWMKLSYVDIKYNTLFSILKLSNVSEVCEICEFRPIQGL
jgi:hypothetical protein